MARRAPKAATLRAGANQNDKKRNKKCVPSPNKEDISMIVMKGSKLHTKDDLCTIKKSVPVISKDIASTDEANALKLQKPSDKPRTSFLSLPGEIRNQIYELVFPPQDYEIRRIKKSSGLTYWRYVRSRTTLDPGYGWSWINRRHCLDWNATFRKPNLSQKAAQNRRSQDLVRRNRNGVIQPIEYTTSPLSILSASRQVHEEATTFFYSKNSFGFTSRYLLQRFLTSVGPLARAAIRVIYIQHETYGDPARTAHIRWKELHDERWATFCQGLATLVPGLEELHMLLYINDRPLQMDLGARWAEPLLCFQRLGLSAFWLELAAGTSNNRTFAEDVRKVVLGDAYDGGAERERRLEKERRSRNPPKALKCLVIR